MNGKLWFRAVVGSFLLAVAIVNEARGELITFAFSGTVTTARVDARPQLQGFDFPDVGDTFTGFYTFDSNGGDGAVGSDLGSFTTVLSDRAVGVSIGEFQFEGRGVNIGTSRVFYEVNDSVPSIELASNAALAQILGRNNFSLVIRRENLFLDPNVLPLSPPPLVGAEHAFLQMSMDNGANTSPVPWVFFIASLDSLTVVPEPPSFLLIGIASILLGRRRKNDAPPH